MRNPDAPFLELSFYFADFSGQESLEKLVRHLVTVRGATPKTAYTLDNCGQLNRRLVTYDLNHKENRIGQASALWDMFTEANQTITKIALEKGTGIVKDAREFAVQLPIKRESADFDHNPVAVWVEGVSFCHPLAEAPVQSREVGIKVMAVFRELVQALKPSYATITVDYALECPSDLRWDSRTLAFRDFYVARDYVGENGISALAMIEPHAYHEVLPDGHIVCCSGVFAPTTIQMAEIDSEVLSIAVGKLLARIP